MISIDLVYRTLLFFANSDVRGNVTPTDIRLAINNAVNEIYEDYLYQINQLVNRQNRGLINGGPENIPKTIRERLQHFLIPDTELIYDNISGTFTLPEDYRYFDTVYYNGTAEVEICRTDREFKQLSKYVDTAPTATYPIYLKVGDAIKVAPASIDTDITISYLREPKIANWTFTIINDTELFNPSASDFQDIDLHPGEQYNLVVKAAKLLGINLKEQDITAVTQNTEAQEFNQNLSS